MDSSEGIIKCINYVGKEEGAVGFTPEGMGHCRMILNARIKMF